MQTRSPTSQEKPLLQSKSQLDVTQQAAEPSLDRSQTLADRVTQLTVHTHETTTATQRGREDGGGRRAASFLFSPAGAPGCRIPSHGSAVIFDTGDNNRQPGPDSVPTTVLPCNPITGRTQFEHLRDLI